MTPRVKLGVGLTSILLAGLLASCYIPEKFTASLHINKDYTCTFEFDGTLVGALTLEQRATNGVFTLDDEATFLLFGQDVFNKENGFTKALYKGKGVWDVSWRTQGKLGQTNIFIDGDIPILGTSISGNTITVKGMNLSPADIKEARRLKLNIDGTIKVSTDCEIVSHNAPKGPRGWFGSPTLTWNVTLDNPTAPEVVLSSPNPAPVFAGPSPASGPTPKPDAREGQLRSALARNPTNTAVALDLAKYYQERGRPQDGYAVFDQLLSQKNIDLSSVLIIANIRSVTTVLLPEDY
jgi:hypothetical protein